MSLSDAFSPKSIAVIGASRDEGSVGYGVLKNLLQGSVLESPAAIPFKGNVYAINPNAQEILGRSCLPSILAVKERIDLAIICVPSSIVSKVMQECGQQNVRAAIIISAGFRELGKEGLQREEEVLAIAKKYKITLIGPNCLGIITPKMNASFAPVMPLSGNVALISQSGALADSVADWSLTNKYGFSTIISCGNMADVGMHEYVQYLDKDKQTKAIAIYMEGLADGKTFLATVRKTKKPVIILKAGKSDVGKTAVSSHTGSLAGSYTIAKSVFHQVGAHVADSVEELLAIAKGLALQQRTKGPIAIVTNGGGCGVLCSDACSTYGVQLAELPDTFFKKIDAKMHPAYSRRNPLDIVGDALPQRYAVAVQALLAEKAVAGVIVIQTLQTMTKPLENAALLVQLQKKFPKKTIISCFMGGKHTQPSIDFLEKNGIPNYSDPALAARVMASLQR